METYLRIILLVAAFLFGAILGSFACCQAWRIRMKEQGKKSPGKWSVCLSCGKRLKKSENIPIFSWFMQKGKCKSCGAKIGVAEILSELTLAVAMPLVLNVLFDKIASLIIDNQIAGIAIIILQALVIIASMTVMWILLIYDAKWKKLPTFLLATLNICAVIYVALSVTSQFINGSTFQEVGVYLLRALGSAALLAGPYFLLSTFSKEKLVGSGDWLIALPIALILGHFWLALVTLFVANGLGSIIGLIYKARSGQKQIPFGPFLVVAFVLVYSLQSWLLSLIVVL